MTDHIIQDIALFVKTLCEFWFEQLYPLGSRRVFSTQYSRFVLKNLGAVALLGRVHQACTLHLGSRLVKIEEVGRSRSEHAISIVLESVAMLDHLQPQQLLADCRKVQIDRSHEKFCLELFRRAIIGKSQECWAALYEQYGKLVYSWTVEYAKTNAQVGGYPIDDLVQDAFAAFWRSFTPAHFARAAALGSVLKYLKSCAWSSVQHAVRKIDSSRDAWDLNPADVVVSSADSLSPEQVVLSKLQAEQLWRAVESCCFEPRDQRIARMRFVEGLKPKEIVARYPDLVQSENEVHKLLRNIKDRLHRSPYVQELQKDGSV
jgi:RNA polymerase sigma factor (sigma-70 family)